jgi:hypothetical protein
LAARALPLGGGLLLALGLTCRLDLLGLLQRQLELLLGQALGPATEAMTLELRDDLTQPLALCPLGEQHRLEHAGIVGKGVGGGRHEAD